MWSGDGYQTCIWLKWDLDWKGIKIVPHMLRLDYMESNNSLSNCKQAKPIIVNNRIDCLLICWWSSNSPNHLHFSLLIKTQCKMNTSGLALSQNINLWNFLETLDLWRVLREIWIIWRWCNEEKRDTTQFHSQWFIKLICDSPFACS